MSKELTSQTPAASTPSSHWHAEGAPDPHAGHYDGERAALTMGKLTDDELANGAFMNYDQPLNLAGILAGTHSSPIAWMTAVKDRIRWLSRSLEKAAAEHGALADKLRTTEAAYTSAMEAGKALAKQAFKAEQERDALAASLKDVAVAVVEQVDLFGQRGEVCSFEGSSMIYAGTLMELGDKVASIVERHSKDAGADSVVLCDQTPTTEDINLLEWKGMDGVFAFHAIERHADDWNHVARLMNAWLEANRGDLVAELKALKEQKPVATQRNSSLGGLRIENHAPDVLEAGMKLYAHPVPAKKLTDIVDDLSQQIRKINGNNSMGACALAERIAEWADNRLGGEGT